jgi:hypothetical protein
VLVQLRDKLVADAEGFNVPEGHTKHPFWRGGGGPPESTGRGLQEERRPRTQEAPSAPDRRETRPEGIRLGRHGRGNPATGLSRNLRGRRERRFRQAEKYGQRERPPPAVGESYQAEYSEHGKAMYLGKALTEVRSPQRKLAPDRLGWSNASQPHGGE